MLTLGVAPQALAQQRQPREAAARGATLKVAPHLWPAVELFYAMRTQWRVAAGMAGLMYLGLDYAALPAAMQMLGAQPSPRLFVELRVMETEAIRWFADRT